MSVTAPATGSGLAALTGWSGSALLEAMNAEVAPANGEPAGPAIRPGPGAMAGAARAAIPAGAPRVQAAAATPPVRAQDRVAIAPPSPTSALWQMATTGLRQMAALLPAVERALSEQAFVPLAAPASGSGKPSEPSPAPLGQLARAVGDAAHLVGVGYAAVASARVADLPVLEPRTGAESFALPEQERPAQGPATPRAAAQDPGAPPGPEALGQWRLAAREVLHDASDLLARAAERLQPEEAFSDPMPLAAPNPAGSDLAWAMTQLGGAQRQVAATIATLDCVFTPRPRHGAQHRLRWGATGELDPASSAVALLGGLILLVLLGLFAEFWVAATFVVGLLAAVAGALVWGWRVVVSARGLRLELRRQIHRP